MNLRALAPLAFAGILALTGCGRRATALTEAQKTTIRQEVLQVMKPFFAEAERMDPNVEKTCLDNPDFAYASIDGKSYAYPEFKKMWAEAVSQFASQSFVIRGEKVIVLAPDAALYCWCGANDMVQKNGTVLRADPYCGTYLLRKMGGTWKVTYMHESSLPMAPAKK